MCPVNGTIQCDLGMGLANVLYEWDLSYVPWEWDNPMCSGDGTSQCTLGMGLVNVPWK